MFSRRFLLPKKSYISIAAVGCLALVAFAVPEAATAAPGDSGSVTSVAYTPGKAQGSGKWGVVGDVKTYEGSNTFTYGLDINPVTGSLTVSDSGKVGYSAGRCFLFGLPSPYTSPCQGGTPSLADYASAQPSDGTADASATEYTGSGGYAVSGAPSSIRTRNTGLGQLFSTYANRTNVTYPANLENGPRGIVHTSDGVAWVVNSEAVAQLSSGAPNVVNRFDTSLNQLSGAGFTFDNTGTYSENFNRDKDKPGVMFYPTGVDVNSAGEIVSNSQRNNRMQVFNNDGTWKRSILLDVGPVSQSNLQNVRDPYSVGTDRVDGSFYVPLVNFRDRPAVFPTPFLEKRDASGAVIGQFTSSDLPAGQVMYGAEIEPITRHVFSWSEFSNVVEWDKNGVQQNVYAPGNGVGQFPGMSQVRAIDFDANGRMFATAAEGTTNTRVMILGKTPDAISSVCVDRSGTTARFQVECGASDDAVTPYQQTRLLDYVIEGSTDGGATWSVLPKDKGAVSADRDQSVSGLTANATYIFRASGWNEAGNGDWLEASSADYSATNDTFTTTAGTAVSVNVATNDTGASVPTSLALVNALGERTASVTVDSGVYSIANSEVKFTPNAGFSGTPEPATVSFLFGGCEKRSQISGTVNDAPVSTLTLSATGVSSPQLSATGPTNFSGTTTTAVTPGSYTLTAAAREGYTISAWSCAPTAATGNIVLISEGDTVTCSVVYSAVVVGTGSSDGELAVTGISDQRGLLVTSALMTLAGLVIAILARRRVAVRAAAG